MSDQGRVKERSQTTYDTRAQVQSSKWMLKFPRIMTKVALNGKRVIQQLNAQQMKGNNLENA